MLFNSYIFILLFLPLTLTGYYLINKTGKYRLCNIFLIGMSLWFYGYFNPSYLMIICGSIVVNYFFSRLLLKKEQKGKKLILTLSICINVAIIFYYKYYDFFVSNINAVFRASFQLKHIVLPLGISFFTIQQISYLVDSYRGETDSYSFDEYALFVSFFPQLVAGPIVLHNEILPQFRDERCRRFDYTSFARGMFIFAMGLFKKVMLADVVGSYADYGFSVAHTVNFMEGITTSLAYTLQLYFDFSGYCDMAIGIAAMMNIELPANFNSPYRATSIVEFWSRWHMSLTRFLRTYIYFPLGGSRKGTARTYLNIMIVFAVSGLWHGANWTFIVWGLLHGLFNCFDRAAKPILDKIWKPVRWLFTFTTVSLLFSIFRADSLKTAGELLQGFFSFKGLTIDIGYFQAFMSHSVNTVIRNLPGMGMALEHFPGLVFWALIIFMFIAIFKFKNSGELEFKPNTATSLLTVIMIMLPLINLAHKAVFLYFNF